MTVFVDMSAIFAVLDDSDVNHANGEKALRRLLESGQQLITTNYVLLEIAALLQSRLGLSALRTFHQDIAPLINIEWISERRHAAAVEMVLAADRKKLSVVDCVSFQTMRDQGITAAFCFDRHFREQGFETIP